MRVKNTAIASIFILGFVEATRAQEGRVNPSRLGNPVASQEIPVNDEIRITGCLSKNDKGQFQLRHAIVEAAPWVASVAKKTVGVAVPMKSATTFDLTGGTGLDGYLGQTVEVTGVVGPGSANTPATPDSIGGPGGTGGIPPGGVARYNRPTLNVKKIKEIGAICP